MEFVKDSFLLFYISGLYLPTEQRWLWQAWLGERPTSSRLQGLSGTLPLWRHSPEASPLRRRRRDRTRTTSWWSAAAPEATWRRSRRRSWASRPPASRSAALSAALASTSAVFPPRSSFLVFLFLFWLIQMGFGSVLLLVALICVLGLPLFVVWEIFGCVASLLEFWKSDELVYLKKKAFFFFSLIKSEEK